MAGDRMNTYQVTHRVTGEYAIVKAVSAQEACTCMGWLIGDCHVKQAPLWQRTPDVIEEDGQRLGTHYDQADSR